MTFYGCPIGYSTNYEPLCEVDENPNTLEEYCECGTTEEYECCIVPTVDCNGAICPETGDCENALDVCGVCVGCVNNNGIFDCSGVVESSEYQDCFQNRSKMYSTLSSKSIYWNS